MSTITKTPSTPTTVAAAPVCAQESPELYRFRLEQYEQMGRAGILTEEDRVELVEGVLYRKPMKKGTHSIAARETAAALARTIPAESYFVTREDPVRIPGRAGMPEPDVSVVRGKSRDYSEQPAASDVALVVEVGEKSLTRWDLTRSSECTPAAAIPVYLDRQPLSTARLKST